MPDLKSIKFPGSEAVYEVVDAAARSRLSTLEGSVGTLVDDTLSESGKAADALAAREAISEAEERATAAAASAASSAAELRYVLNQVIPSGGESGRTVVLDDTIDAPLVQLKLYGRSEQDGTPSASAPVEITNIGADGSVAMRLSGKNLLDVSFLNDIGSTVTSNGVTAVVEDGVINCAGKATGTARFKARRMTVAAGTYTVSRNALASSYDFKISFEISDVTDPLSPQITTVTGQSYTMTFERESTIIIGVAINSNTNMEGIRLCLMLEAGEAATQFVPYAAGIDQEVPMPNSYGLPGVAVGASDDWTYQDDATGEYWQADEIDFARGVYVKRCGVIESYAGETIPGAYISTTGGLDTGATVIYALDEAVETGLTSAQLAAFKRMRSFTGGTMITSVEENQPCMEVQGAITMRAYINGMIYVSGEKLVIEM